MNEQTTSMTLVWLNLYANRTSTTSWVRMWTRKCWGKEIAEMQCQKDLSWLTDHQLLKRRPAGAWLSWTVQQRLFDLVSGEVPASSRKRPRKRPNPRKKRERDKNDKIVSFDKMPKAIGMSYQYWRDMAFGMSMRRAQWESIFIYLLTLNGSLGHLRKSLPGYLLIRKVTDVSDRVISWVIKLTGLIFMTGVPHEDAKRWPTSLTAWCDGWNKRADGTVWLFMVTSIFDPGSSRRLQLILFLVVPRAF